MRNSGPCPVFIDRDGLEQFRVYSGQSRGVLFEVGPGESIRWSSTGTDCSFVWAIK